ncbi:MAG: HD domain-containing protein [Planctomycetota bacterium]|nr:MAG: HD domain-containing protein [Planctomycetota bacterium]
MTKPAAHVRQRVADLRDGDSVDEVYLLVDKQLRANRNANLYLLAQVRDGSGTISVLMWNVTEGQLSHIQAGDFVRVRGKVQLYQGNLQVIASRVEKVDAAGRDRSEFEPRPSTDVEQRFEQLRALLLAIEDVDVRDLLRCFLDDEWLVVRLKQAVAGVRAHHAYPGGLLDHVTNMADAATRLKDLYPTVDHSLLMAGVFLHDLGKVREIDPSNTSIYTDEGQLIGHVVIGIEMLNEAVATFRNRFGREFPAEKLLRIKHMILSHHGRLEFGSPKLPMTPEAIALHHLDNLDAKVNEFSTVIASDPNSQARWTPFIPRIDRKLFKGTSGE